MTPRGIRNNNPGNIRPGQPWVGIAGTDTSGGKPGYLIFDTPEHGIRAIVRILRFYHGEGLNTPQKMIEHWAPPSDDNPTAVYAANVAAALGIGMDDEFTLTAETALPFVRAIITQENGEGEWYNADVLTAGIALGLA